MPAKSEKQAKLFRLVRGVQTGDVSPTKVSPTVRKMAKTIKPSSVKDFTKIKEIFNNLKESEYSLSKFKKVKGKTFENLLSENNGLPFDKKELVLFQSKQNGFCGFGKTPFLHNKNKNEMLAEVFSNNSSKKFVFKKLIDVDDKSLYKYACFIKKTFPDNDENLIFYTLSNSFEDSDISEKTKMLGDFINRINSYGI
jgi:hypothetical protein